MIENQNCQENLEVLYIKFQICETVYGTHRKAIYYLMYTKLFFRSRDSLIGIATGYGLDDQVVREFEFR
jgi:hypothetical protein